MARFEEVIKDQFTFRSADENDAEIVSNFRKHLIQTSDHLISSVEDLAQLSVESQKRIHAKYMQSENDLFLLCFKNNDLIGTLTFQCGKHLKNKHSGSISMGIHQNYRGQKIGSSMLGLFIDWARPRKDISRIELEVMSANTPGIRLYKNFGFQEEGIKKNAYRLSSCQFVDSVLMGLIRYQFPF